MFSNIDDVVNIGCLELHDRGQFLRVFVSILIQILDVVFKLFPGFIVGEINRLTSWVDKRKWVIPSISVQINLLRIEKPLHSQGHRINTRESPLSASVVPSPERVQARFVVSLLLRELLPRAVADIAKLWRTPALRRQLLTERQIIM